MTSPPDTVNPPLGLRVLHIAATANGAHWMFEILKGLRGCGYDVMAMISGTGGDLAPKLETAKIPYSVGDLDILSTLAWPSILRKILRLTLYLRRQRFDIVHYHLFPSTILGRIAAWLADAPIRFSMITGPFYLEAPASREIDLRTAWMDSKVIASCHYTRELYARGGLDAQKVNVIYYGADPAHFDPGLADSQQLRRELGISAADSVVGMVAYFYPPFAPSPWTPGYLHHRAIKGHDVLIRAVPHVLARNARVKFLLIGKGWGSAGEQYEQELKDMVQRMGLEDAVIFTGYRPDIPNALAGLDVSIQCSLNENLGGTIESLLMTRPTVASSVGGMVDSVRHGQTGLLVPPDDPEQLADAILYLLDHPAEAAQMGKNGRQLMLAEFSLSKTVEDIDKLYRTIACDITVRSRKTAPLAKRYYRIHTSLARLVYFSVYWVWPLVVRESLLLLSSKIRQIDAMRSRSQASGQKAARNIGQVMITLLSSLAKGTMKVLVGILPLLLPILVLTYFLPGPWRVLLLGLVLIGLVIFRILYAGPTLLLVRLMTKHLFDLLVATAILIGLAPLWVLIGLAIRIESPGPLLLSKRCIGRHGLDFDCYSFRTMTWTDGEKNACANETRHAPRLTQTGRIIRILGLVRVPQFLNVFRGEMSIVGPSPHPVLERIDRTTRPRRYNVKPGLTGLECLQEHPPLSNSDDIDIGTWYADHWSFWLDLVICLKACRVYFARWRPGKGEVE